MAPLSTVIQTTLGETLADGTHVYHGKLDKEWTIGSVAFGGAMLAFILDTSSKFQSRGNHHDPIYLTSQFLRAVIPGAISIKVRAVRKGKQVDVLEAGVYQKDMLMITSQLIYGDLSSPFGVGPTLPNVYKPICPLSTHPADAQVENEEAHKVRTFYKRYRLAEDPTFLEYNANIPREGRNIDGLLWGAWIELEKDVVGPNVIPIVADLGQTTWRLLPDEITENKVWWYPSLAISLEFKRKLPLEGFAPHSFGLFARKRHLEGGRWNDSLEIWSAPGAIGDPRRDGDEDWRERMVCLAVGSQVALMVPPEINNRYVSGKTASKL